MGVIKMVECEYVTFIWHDVRGWTELLDMEYVICNAGKLPVKKRLVECRACLGTTIGTVEEFYEAYKTFKDVDTFIQYTKAVPLTPQEEVDLGIGEDYEIQEPTTEEEDESNLFPDLKPTFRGLNLWRWYLKNVPNYYKPGG
jgi:hypothetical protein